MPQPPQRLTFISDPTDEFPDNKNNSFKVRLPSRMVLEGPGWHASLWGISVPDGDIPLENVFAGISETEAAVGFGCTYATLSPPMQSQKYTSVAYTTFYPQFTLPQIMSNTVRTGVDFWKSAVELYHTKITDELHGKQSNALNKQLVLPMKWFTECKWDGEDLLLIHKEKNNKTDVRRSEFKVLTPIALLFGLIEQDDKGVYRLGPNAIPTMPWRDYDSKETMVSSLLSSHELVGKALHYVQPHDIAFGYDISGLQAAGYDTKWAVYRKWVYFTTSVDWRFIFLNRSFEQAQNRKETVMIYSDLVQSTIMGSGRFPLLRQLTLQRNGQGRQTVEPYHREWIPLRANTIETVELELATASGPLTHLTKGKTIVTVGLQQL